MNVYLSAQGRDQLPGDLIQRWVLRSDLTPVPRTVELTLQIKEGIQERFAVGNTFWTGRELLEYEVVKVKQEKAGGYIQGKDQLAALSITALLASCAQITYVRERAVVRQNATLGALFRACGATLAIGSDFNVARFACYVGQVPSFYLALALQEESAVLVLRDGRLSAIRLHDLMRQEPIDSIGQTDSSDRIASEFLERHSIPSCYSLDDYGNFVMGDFDAQRGIHFMPRTSERQLRNASRVLVTRRIVDSDIAQQIRAGDVLSVNGERLAVITAAHAMQQKDGITETSSRFWMGSLV